MITLKNLFCTGIGLFFIAFSLPAGAMGSRLSCDEILSSSEIKSLIRRYVPYGKDGDSAPAYVFSADANGDPVDVIYANKEHRYQAIASTQKMLSAWVLYKYGIQRGALNLKTKLRFRSDFMYFDVQGPRSLDDEGNVIQEDKIRRIENRGEMFTVSLSRLLYNMLYLSSNGAPMAIAEGTAGSQEAFVRHMNDEVENLLGLEGNSYFQNPHGLTDTDSRYKFADNKYKRQQSSPRELAYIEAKIMGHAGFRSFLSSAGLMSKRDGRFIKYGITRAAGTTVLASFALPAQCRAKNLVLAIFGRTHTYTQGRTQIQDFNQMLGLLQEQLN